MPEVDTRYKQWTVAEVDDRAVDTLSHELGISPLVASVLLSRGISDPLQASAYLNPSLQDLHSPSLLPDFDPAVGEILGAKESGKRVFVHGDYDADGVTSAALFTRFLRRLGCDVVPHVPHRTREGYGIHLDAVKMAAEAGCKLFLTCDCGISAHEQVAAANSAGMRVVVTDHHEVGETLPPAAAVVNPHRRDSQYPFKHLSGVGVVFKLCQGITQELKIDESRFFRAYLDLAALGTIADVMPLIDENRIIASHGLTSIKHSKKPGLRSLLRVCELDDPSRKITARNVGFQIAPRINAAGRMADSRLALDLLLEDDPEKADVIAELLDETNRQRRVEQAHAYDEAVELVEQTHSPSDRAIVVSREGWHPGLIGIVAGKLAEQYYRPTFVVTIDENGHARGSARSIPGFNLGAAIDAARPHLSSGGGHEQAAGFSLEASKLEGFALAMKSYANSVLTDDDLVPRIEIDAIIDPSEASNPRVVEELAALAPFGQGNPEPTFGCLGLTTSNIAPTSNPAHVRLSLIDTSGTPHKAMAFGIGEGLSALGNGAKIDIVFRPDENVFRGKAEFRWLIDDYRPSGN
ncbi:MAG: single-stranded-DNA-specific exonuclease RecJ [Armatimonadetes bacterium]|nr:single-stranded-DNA-specific exonuclease RecJ [Armatimonadota bacterium]